jgi:hypothetical protein
MTAPQPSIEIFDIVIHTPVTALTDVIVAAICLVAYFKLKQLPQHGEVHRLFKYYFLSMSMATFLGGVLGHALLHYLPFYMKIPGWITSMLSVALLERAVIQYARRFVSEKVGTIFAWINVIELLTFMVLALVTLNFKFVLAHAAYGMAIVVLGFTTFIYKQEKSLGSKQILLAVLLCSIGAFFFVFKIGIDKWFNHVDISHVFMMIASVYYYKGGKNLILSTKLESTLE